jgi:hypothetical protein
VRCRQLFKIVGKVGLGEHFLQVMLGIEEALPVVVDQTLEDRLFGFEMVIEVAGRLVAGLGDLAHRGRAVTLGGEKLERHLQHLGGGDFRPLGLASVGPPRHPLDKNRTFVM